jgi:hypothetical protein
MQCYIKVKQSNAKGYAGHDKDKGKEREEKARKMKGRQGNERQEEAR